ncbi:hypothetical protein QR680_001477 [Steinernema hermaphroditum]|uniref:DRIM domain-containing protein n=1 Tax=Steinernema hermaphroditum TaxID=289476 RepID=A0AA39LFK8_9BILA|nr:hypothetical protein QR680_001477 [Steinernema hermaphroditum]
MKEKNTFKYVSFNEQIAKIGVDITKWRIALPTDAGDQETFFHEAISEYNDKDYGDHYKAFLDSVSSKNLRTYAQLLHNQKDVVTALLQQLSVERGSSYETLLELSLALARDLREDFYDYLWDFFDAIISILEVNWQSIDILQTGFRVLTTLFKIFWRKIVTELRRTFLRFIPLFGSKTQYIRRFSAESFAFFLRKSNSISKLIVFMIEKALDDGDRRLDNGIAFLIFNAVKGVSKQFVSRADELFKQILDVIVHLEDLHMRTAGTDILLEAMRLSVMYTRREFSYPITSVLLNSLLEYSTQGDSAANNVAALINVWIAERQGSVFSQHDELCQYLHKIAIALDHNLHITPSFLDLIAASLRMYNSESKSLSRVPETIKPFVDRASSSLSVAQVLQLFESLSCADVFDIWILPSMCHFTEECIKQQENEDVVLSFYAQFVSNRRPISVTTSTTSRDAVFSASLLPNLRRLVVQLLREGRNANPQHLLYCVVIWPWIWGNLGDAKQASDEVFALFNEIIMSSDVLSSDSMRLLAHCSYSISLVAPDLITRADSGKITQIISNKSQEDTWCLRFARIVLPLIDNWSEQIPWEIFTCLLNFDFSNPLSECRIMAFELADLYIKAKHPGFGENVFTILLKVERTPLTIQEYRSRAVLLRRLNPDCIHSLLPGEIDVVCMCQLVLGVLLSQYFENFTIYWPQVTEIICSFAEGMEIDSFWNVVLSHIGLCQLKLHNDLQAGINEPPPLRTLWIGDESRKLNYSSCRIQLFKMLSRISFICKKKTGYLSPLILEVYKNEYCKFKAGSPTQNLLMNGEGVGCDKEAADVSNKLPAKLGSQKAFLALLELFANFTRPRKVHKEKLVFEMYMELLLSGIEEIQKAAIKCLFTYQEKFLLNYKENIENLTSPQKFNDEIVKFSIDEQNMTIAEADREKIMPYLMRIVFGLLHLQNSAKIDARRSAIFRFLSGCRSSEVQIFLDLTFRDFIIFHDGRLTSDFTAHNLCAYIENNFNLSACLRLKWLKSALKNVLQVLRNMITVLDSDQRNQVFRIALACSHHVRLISENKLSIDPCFHGQIKDLRQTVNITLCQVFRTLQESVDEGCVDALLDAVLIPICVSRNNRPFTSFTEGIPEGVAKIFLSLTSVPTLFPLLNKKLHHENWEEIGNAEVTPIALLTAFLKCKSTSSSSALDVVEGIRNLLTLDCESKHRYEISCPGRLVELKHATYGTRLVITYIRPILEFLCETLSSEKCSSLPVYLDMLNRISEYVTDPSVCEVFCCTLLKLTKSGSAARKPDDVKNLLYAVAKLIVNVKEPFIFASEIFSLFPSTPAKEVRQALVSVVEHFSMNKNIEDKDIVKQISIIVQLESWDARRIDEPDFERRHTGFSALSSLCAIRDYKIETYCLEAYAAISCHYLKTGSDLSLKAAAISCLRDLTRYMALPQNKDLRLLSTVFIPECLNGLRHSNESVRLEFLTFLACLVRFCGYHSQLEKLQCLLNDDVELDFFAGVGHIQLHRRQRSFFSLCKGLANGQVDIPVSVLMRFILPLIQPYLMNFTSRTSTLSDQALSLFAEVLKKASWAKYYHILNDYIKQLMNEQDKDKPIIRVIVKIIDSFHFDIKDVVLPDDFTTVTYVDKSDTAVENTNSDDDEADVATERKVAIIRKLVTGILPRLKKCIDGKDERHVAHKKAEKYYNEDDDVLRAPIALATVKLLKKLPTKILQQNLHGVVLKLCSLVLSRSYNVREVARKTMVSALKALGAEYLPFVIKEMKQIMNKGYQVHVMIYTVHVLISAMKDDLKAGGIDPCLLDIIEICKIDQFSDVTEEKNISGITHHVAEAKADKSCETYQFIGQFIGSASLNIVVEPLMHIIEERPQSKTVKTIGRLLESYSAGLCLNEGIDVPTLLVFVYQMLVRYTTAIEGREKSDDVEEKSLRPQSCLLLPKAPTRIGVIVKTSVKSKSFVFVEFALALFNAILKKTKSGFSSDQAVRHLDPFVPLVVCCLRLKHDRVVSGALRAIVAILEYPLPQLKLSITKIVETLFVLLADYAGMGRAGEKISILELTQNLFKAFTRIMRDSPIELFSTKRIQILLNYIETDITDPNKQATAFSLLKAILSKKIVDDKLPDLMRHLSEVSIMSHAANVRAQCRQILTFFVSTHPMGKDTAKFIEFFLAQLDYEHEDGRLSAIETLNLAYTTFVEDVVDKFALVSFIRLSMGLVNEESQNCRKYLALALRSLVQSCSEKARNDLYLAARDWLESDNDSSRYLAARSLVEFFESDSSALSSTVPELMAIISKTLTEELISSSSEDSTVALFKLASMMAVKCSAKFIDTVLCLDKCKNFWENFRHFAMCIESPDVQMVAAEFLGHLFSALTLKNSKISELPLSSSELSGFMFWQLKSKQLTTIQADQVIKNLVYLAKNTQIEDYYTFFANKLSQVCKYEINHIPDQAVRRVSVFKLAAAVFLHGDGPLIEEVISNIVPYLTRELNGKSDKHTEELKQMASEVCEILKTAVGEKRYTSLLAEAQRQLNMRTVERKQQRKELATVAPELAAERKLRKHKARIVAQKRRLEEFKPYRKAKRARREELED